MSNRVIITREWLLEHRTARGAWTKAQFAIIGISWPPLTGWMSKVIGRGISAEDAERFDKLRVKVRHPDHWGKAPNQMTMDFDEESDWDGESPLF